MINAIVEVPINYIQVIAGAVVAIPASLGIKKVLDLTDFPLKSKQEID